ncbi:APC family permease [Pedobacter xixiisoli]|uniref:Amino acid/polyamine/organocation transporter, APC superfamily n=1 Tax=Pedobacter xixiisoli TaxID=1476464 RepID=A0A285ZQM7_9SPHI|nr:amino acid permease [Pedobacter xixiisoli]SOD11949.1 amino acid/polyamine/organocation transporter, APC superfamily [Pedobacter xixiisoli]
MELQQEENGKQFKRELNLLDATLLVVGSMVGSGIFIVSADIARHTGSAGWLILVWIIGGFMTLTAALSYGELSGMYPKAGGQYVYLKESYNPLTAFLYGWSLFAVIQTGTIAAVGVSFYKFLAYFIPSVSEDLVLFSIGSFKVSPAQVLAIGLIFILTYINTKGVKGGKWIQLIFTLTKIASIAGLIIFGFVFFKSDVVSINWSDAFSFKKILPDGSFLSYENLPAFGGALASALVGAIMSYEAWNNVTFVAGEINNPKKNIGLSLLLGTLLVTLIYVLLNLMFTMVLPLTEIATTEKDRVGIAASQAIFGANGTIIIALLIMVATFGCNNGLILAGARVYYSMAKDGLFFKKTAKLNKHAVPEFALWIQFVMASILCLSGKYGDLLDMITFIAVLFYVLTIFGIYILRVKKPDVERPYKAIGYPVLPAIYIVLGLSFCILLIIYKPYFTWPGLIITLIGIPLYYWNKRTTVAE